MRSFTLVALAALLVVACSDDTDPNNTGGGGMAQGSGGSGGASNPNDIDGDGHESVDHGGDDCDDGDPDVYPGAEDTVGDAVDQNCDEVDGVDADGDSYASVESGGTDCDDTNNLIHPGASDDGELGQTQIWNEGSLGGQSTAIAVDAAGKVHIVFGERYTVGNLVQLEPRYITNQAGEMSWDHELVAGALGSGIGLWMHIDAADALHMVFTGGNETRYGLLDTATMGSSWDIAPVSAGYASGMALDSAGSLGIVVSQGSTMNLATLSGGLWETNTLPGQRTDGALAFNAAGAPVVSSLSGGVAESATFTNGTWSSEIVGFDVDDHTAIAIDSAGSQFILFSGRDANDDDVIVAASNESNGWATQEILSIPGSADVIQARVDAQDTVHAIVGLSHYGNHLHYLAKPKGKPWASYPLHVNGDYGAYSSMTLTADGTIHLAYFGGKELYYASIAAANGVDDNCNGQIW